MRNTIYYATFSPAWLELNDQWFLKSFLLLFFVCYFILFYISVLINGTGLT